MRQNRIFQVLDEPYSSRLSPMRKLPPLTTLRAFEAAARHLSFKEAAEELGVTPTAISHQIRLLEEFCGRSLFQRRPRPLKRFPVELNRWESHEFRDQRVFEH